MALLIVNVGQAPAGIVLFTNLRLAPRAPLFLPATAAWLWLLWSYLSLFLAVSTTAAVVEEVAFRGYMLSQVQRRYGWAVAITLVAGLFYVVHLSHVYATIAFLPSFAAYSVLHGGLVFLSRSILPSVARHAIGDFCVLPMQYGVVELPFGTSYGPYLACVLLLGLAALLAFWRLMSLTRGSALCGAEGRR